MYCFILYISLALLTRPGHGMTLPSASESAQGHEPAVLDLKNAAEIIQLLKVMNKGIVENRSLQRQNSGPPGIDIDYLGVSEEKNDIVNELMEMIKKNYNTKEKQLVLPNDRLIYISNPEVLEEYKKQQKTKQSSASTDSEGGERDADDSIANQNLLEVLQHLRRFDQIKDQNNEENDEAEKIKAADSIDTFAMIKNEIEHKINLRAGRDEKFDSLEDKFEPFEAKQDAFDTKTTKVTLNKNDNMKSSGEKSKISWVKKKEDKREENNRFKNNDRWNDDYSPKNNRNQKKNAKLSNPILSKIKMQDNPSFIKFGSLPKPKAKRERKRPQEASGFHSYGRTPVPIVGKRGIYEEEE